MELFNILNEIVNFFTDGGIGVALFVIFLAVARPALLLLHALVSEFVNNLRANREAFFQDLAVRAKETQTLVDDLFVEHMDKATETAIEATLNLIDLDTQVENLRTAFDMALEPARLRFEALMKSYGWQNAIDPGVVTTQISAWLMIALEERFLVDLDGDGFIGEFDLDENDVIVDNEVQTIDE